MNHQLKAEIDRQLALVFAGQLSFKQLFRRAELIGWAHSHRN